MKFLITLLFVGVIFHESFGQVGVKTRQPISSGSHVYNNTYSSSYNAGAEVVYVSEIDKFLNRTRSGIAPGKCTKEVPTASLVPSYEVVPAGNGSDSSMSVIMVCCDGYERNVHNFHQCDPICKNECANGICVAPDVCTCYPDHVRNLGGFCIPTCPIGCGNGDCAPNHSCICKPGYILEASGKFCIPHCRQDCGNGNCTAPDTCECREGYESGPDNICTPKCDDCINGQCTAPGICNCRPGFMKQRGRCEPVCPQGCDNGLCIAPNVCSCKPGWAMDPAGRTCIPSCDEPCLNGVCSGSNTCTCNSGYIQDQYKPNVCVAHCPNGCPNGVCSGPNFCICNPGYMKERGVKGREACVPHA